MRRPVDRHAAQLTMRWGTAPLPAAVVDRGNRRLLHREGSRWHVAGLCTLKMSEARYLAS